MSQIKIGCAKYMFETVWNFLWQVKDLNILQSWGKVQHDLRYNKLSGWAKKTFEGWAEWAANWLSFQISCHCFLLVHLSSTHHPVVNSLAIVLLHYCTGVLGSHHTVLVHPTSCLTIVLLSHTFATTLFASTHPVVNCLTIVPLHCWRPPLYYSSSLFLWAN